jgi:hypothetical protein
MCIHLNIKKNNNIGILWSVVVFAMSRQCVNLPNLFSYVCSEFLAKLQRKSITCVVKKAYELYFRCKVWDQNKSWEPHS